MSMFKEKTPFVEKFGSSLMVCNASGQYIWKDQICDSVKDCNDSEDEKNCSTSKFNILHSSYVVFDKTFRF